MTIYKKPRVKVFFNNNPRCRAELENIVKREKWELVNTPSITVKGSNFENGKTTMEVAFKDQTLSKEISIVDHRFVEKIELLCPLEDPKEIEVKVGTFHGKVSVVLNRLYGRATYFDGTTVPYPIIVTEKGIGTVGDEMGNFEIILCGREKHVGIFGRNYSKETLECWLYDVELEEDTELDIKIDKLEVYELGAWLAYSGVYIHFIPMSLTRVLELVKKGLSEDEISECPEAWPHLRKEDVKAFVGDKEVPISSFDEYNSILRGCEGKIATRPGYIIGIDRSNLEKVRKENEIIRVEIEHRVNLDGKEVLERGEGYFFGFVKEE